jgi:hypothetical protein
MRTLPRIFAYVIGVVMVTVRVVACVGAGPGCAPLGLA